MIRVIRWSSSLVRSQARSATLLRFNWKSNLWQMMEETQAQIFHCSGRLSRLSVSVALVGKEFGYPPAWWYASSPQGLLPAFYRVAPTCFISILTLKEGGREGFLHKNTTQWPWPVPLGPELRNLPVQTYRELKKFQYFTFTVGKYSRKLIIWAPWFPTAFTKTKYCIKVHKNNFLILDKKSLSTT